jgi:predicted DNA-binding protein YlxM (UPF0122 family)
MYQTPGSRWRLRSLTDSMLTQLYTEEGLSLDEIPIHFGCTRQAVHKKLRQWEIPARRAQP